jgi:hypothetical protein
MTATASDVLLPHLQGVRSTGHGKWIARCPAHDDKRPSLSIKEGDTGALLVYCWAGCSVQAIVAAAGVELADLFPPREVESDPRAKWKPWRQKLANGLTPFVVRFQSDLILAHIFLADTGEGKPIAPNDRETARAAAGRLWAALRDAQHAL